MLCSDISKMYNMLKLSDQALPYSLFLYNDSLSDDTQPDVYCMQSAWYGVSSSGNQANVALFDGSAGAVGSGAVAQISPYPVIAGGLLYVDFARLIEP